MEVFLPHLLSPLQGESLCFDPEGSLLPPKAGSVPGRPEGRGKNLIVSISYKIEILRLTPQNDIMAQRQRGEGKGGEVRRLNKFSFRNHYNFSTDQYINCICFLFCS